MPRFDRSLTDELLGYLAASPSPYHAAANAADRLSAAGFRQLTETDAWDDEPGGRYLIRGGALIARHIPAGAAPACPFRVVTAPTAGARPPWRFMAVPCSIAGWIATSAWPAGWFCAKEARGWST